MKKESSVTQIYLRRFIFDERIKHSSREKASRLYLRRKHQHLCGQLFMREVLAVKVSCEIDDLHIGYEKAGQPYLILEGQKLTKPYFSLSHSNDLMAIAISEIRPVGIDLEFMNTDRDFTALQAYLSIKQDANTVSAFYQAWTTFEAKIKANIDRSIWRTEKIHSFEIGDFMISCCVAAEESDTVLPVEIIPPRDFPIPNPKILKEQAHCINISTFALIESNSTQLM